MDELRDIIVRVPPLLTSKWATNLKPKIEYLVDRLGLNQTALKCVVTSHPRVLVQSIATSLQPKIKMLEITAGGRIQAVSEVVQVNPSLLLSNKATLQQRVNMLQLRNATFVDAFAPRPKNNPAGSKGTKRKVLTRRKRPVIEILGGATTQEFPDVQAAALTVGTSQANMYNIVKTGREYNGRSYVYGTLPDLPNATYSQEPLTDVATNSAGSVQDVKRILIPEDSESLPDFSSLLLQSSPALPSQKGESCVYLTAFVTGAFYPPEKLAMRGATKSGAIMLYFPQLRGNKNAETLLRAASERCIPGALIPTEDRAADGSGGLVLSTYPYTRPSRNRCTLFGCRSALRLIVELLSSDPTLRDYDVEVDIITDSNHVWELLHDSAALIRWGQYESSKEFVYDGPEPQWKVNSDILYPLARTYYRVRNQMFQTPSLGDRADAVAKDLKVRFCHKSQIFWESEDPVMLRSSEIAAKAAKRVYDHQLRILNNVKASQ